MKASGPHRLHTHQVLGSLFYCLSILAFSACFFHIMLSVQNIELKGTQSERSLEISWAVLIQLFQQISSYILCCVKMLLVTQSCDVWILIIQIPGLSYTPVPLGFCECVQFNQTYRDITIASSAFSGYIRDFTSMPLIGALWCSG